MKTLRHVTFEGLDDDRRRRFRDLEIVSCTFDNCTLGFMKHTVGKTVVENVTLRGCSAVSCLLGVVTLRDVTIDGLSTNELALLEGTLFERVRLAGKLGRFKLNAGTSRLAITPAAARRFDEASRRFYGEVDWALDISEALFIECYLEGIPSRLVRRHVPTQAVVTRKRVERAAWRGKLKGPMAPFADLIESFAANREPEVIVVAPRNVSKARQLTFEKGIAGLRRLGLAEPD